MQQQRRKYNVWHVTPVRRQLVVAIWGLGHVTPLHHIYVSAMANSTSVVAVTFFFFFLLFPPLRVCSVFSTVHTWHEIK